MDTFDQFNQGRLALPGKTVDFDNLPWNAHPTFKGVALKHIVTAADTNGQFSYHLVRIDPGCKIGNHIHATQLETHEVIRGFGKLEGLCALIVFAANRHNLKTGIRTCHLRSYGHFGLIVIATT